MSPALQLIASIALIVGGAALFLWFAEAVGRRVGARNAWLLFLVAVPFSISAAIAALNWEELVWWERLAYALSGPVAVIALLASAFVAFNPGDAALLLCTLFRSGWRLCVQRVRGWQRDA